MTIAVCLLFYSLAVAVLGPPLLTRLTKSGAAPRLAVAAWMAAIGSVVMSWAAAAMSVTVDLLHSGAAPGEIISDCVIALRRIARGEFGFVLQTGLLILAGLAATALGVLAWRWSRSMLRARMGTHRHAQDAHVIGRRMPGLDAVVVESEQPAAYCVAGRPNAIIVTTTALRTLDEPQLAAVLAHERAHLAGRHHLILAATRCLAVHLPRIDLMTKGAAGIGRLLEMCADDVAARRHGRRTLLEALLRLSGVAPVPPGALSASGVGVLARAERLAERPVHAHRAGIQLMLGAVVVLATTGPATTTLLAAHGVVTCLPFWS